MAINVLHLNSSTNSGGASRAAIRLHMSLNQYSDSSFIFSSFRCLSGPSYEPRFNVSPPLKIPRLWLKLQARLCVWRRHQWLSTYPVQTSIAWPNTGLVYELNAGFACKKFDVLNLHWLGDNCLSIEEIGQLNCPIVWTLHDQWPFCGAEHYSPWANDSPGKEYRYVCGYSRSSCPPSQLNYDLNRLTWKRKRDSWKKPITLVAPSSWMADSAKQSALASSWPCHIIPNTLDTDQWKPINSFTARDLMCLPQDSLLILFGALGGFSDLRKGADLLESALHHLSSNYIEISQYDIQLVVFGQSKPSNKRSFPYKVNYLGHLSDDLTLKLAYSSCDVMLVPSRQESFGQTAAEAMACGTPVVAFDGTGLVDIVDDRQTGRLASSFDPKSLAECIFWVIKDKSRRLLLGQNSRTKAVDRWRYECVSSQYSEVYKSVVSSVP